MTLLKPIQQIRQVNFRALVRTFDDQKEAAKTLNLTDSQVSDYMNGKKGMGEKLASRIERAAGLKPDELSKRDAHHTMMSGGMLSGAHETVKHVTITTHTPENSPLYGYTAIESVESWQGQEKIEDRYMLVPSKWLEDAGANEDTAVHFIMPDDSYFPKIKTGFPVAVNTKWGGAFKSSSEYAIRIGSTYTLRRVIAQHDGSVILRAENSAMVSDSIVSAEEIKTLDVLGEYICYMGR